MPARHERPSERDRRERMPRLAERGEKKTPARLGSGPRPPSAQSASASTRMIFERSSAVAAIGVVIRVPTPASR